jgi:arylsulfatase A-like enzyme
MIVYSPLCPPRRVKDYVSTIDLGTTILDAVGVPCPDGYTGVSLLPLMLGKPFSHPPIFAQQIVREKDFREVRRDESYQNPKLKKYMIISPAGYKLIYTQQYHFFELYDLKADPSELSNLYDVVPELAGDLRLELGRFVDLSSTGDARTSEDKRAPAED